MRIKKGLALFLVLAMIICLMPASAFASTTATVDKVYAVAADTDMPEVLKLPVQKESLRTK